MATCISTFQTVILTFEVLGFLTQIMEIWKACEKCFQKMITSSSTESVARFVWCKKRCKYRTTFETNMSSIHFLQFLRRFLVRKLPPTHIIPPKPINYIIYSRSICSSIYAYLRSTKKGPTDSIPPGEGAIRAGRGISGGAEAS